MFHFEADHGPYRMDRAPLVRAVVQVGFAPAAHLATADGLAALQDELGDGFALQGQAQQALQISIGQPAVIPQRHVFVNEQGYTLAVTAQDFTLSIDQRYKSRDEFGAMLERVSAVIGAAGKVKQINRIGVRYINALPTTMENFARWFKPEFTGWGAGMILDPKTQRAWVLMTQLSGGEDEIVDSGVIRYGFLPGGVGQDVTSTEAATQPSFVADIDMASGIQRPFDAQALATLFQEINHVIASFFAHTLTDVGREQFGLKPKE
jgi:uncharacterized protein (TIGR04255 family)